MKILKNLFSFLIEPIKLSGSRNFSERVAKFFNQKRAVIYVIALLTTIVLFLCIYLK